jgi:hypothetical protein
MRATSDRAHSNPLIQIKPHSPPGPVSRLKGGYEGKAKRARDLRQPVMQDRKTISVRMLISATLRVIVLLLCWLTTAKAWRAVEA